jgi:hypothetical protein
MKALTRLFASRTSPDQLTVFGILYTIPMLHEMGDPWWSWGGGHAPLPLEIALLGLITFIALNLTLSSLWLFAAMSASYYLFTAFPENPNHITLYIFCHLVLLITVPAVALLRGRSLTAGERFAALKPVLRLSVITLFFIAGFHKVNADFLDPDVSCVNFVVQLFEGRLFRPIFGIPFIVYVLPVGLGIGLWLWRHRPPLRIRLFSPGVAIAAMLMLVLIAGVLLSRGDPRSTIVASGAVLVLLWQLVEGPLLLFRRAQAPILLISAVLLGLISVSGIPMFPAVLMPLLFTFCPGHVFIRWRERAVLSVRGVKVHVIYPFFFLSAAGGLIVYITAAFDPTYEARILALAASQALYFGGVALLLWPLAGLLLSAERDWGWGGVAVWNEATPRVFLVFPLLLLLWGLTPYLGLRTAGNFSMFSNLRTEGSHSNHLLLADNPLKFWSYQEDRVTIIDVDDEAAKIGHHFDSLDGNSLPRVEFRKLVILWRESGQRLGITIDDGAGPERIPDITGHDYWGGVERNWETFWLDFRPVQESGPNACRW